MELNRTDTPYRYVTVKVTQSRIDKGLLAIPVSLLYLFPEDIDEVHIVDKEGIEERKKFTPYKSSSRECRIGGMKDFYEKYEIRKGDELVIMPLGDGRYRIVPEKDFRDIVTDFERKSDSVSDEKEAESIINELSEFLNTERETVVKNEFIRLARGEIKPRKVLQRKERSTRENVPPFIRRILRDLYHGKCQVTGFTFIMKNGNPYFEIHHIRPELGNHPKNLLVVSPNVHAQFTYAHVKHYFDEQGWLRKVKFNDALYSVYQAIDEIPEVYVKEVHF